MGFLDVSVKAGENPKAMKNPRFNRGLEGCRRRDLNPHTLAGRSTESYSRVFLLSGPHSMADHDGRDRIPSVLTPPFNGEIDEGYVAPLIQNRNVQNIRTIRYIFR